MSSGSSFLVDAALKHLGGLGGPIGHQQAHAPGHEHFSGRLGLGGQGELEELARRLVLLRLERQQSNSQAAAIAELGGIGFQHGPAGGDDAAHRFGVVGDGFRTSVPSVSSTLVFSNILPISVSSASKRLPWR